MGSEFTHEAINFARTGGYLNNIHCHLNLASEIGAGNHFLPLSEQYKNSRFCKDGEFAKLHNKTDYFEYSEIVFKELECQYSEFKELTDGYANYQHVDCHLYCNLFLSVAVAYRRLIDKYSINNARYYGEHHKQVKSLRKKLKFQVAKVLNGNKAYAVKSCNVDYYLTMIDSFQEDEIVELYVHPDYIDDVLMDNTVSAFVHEKVPLAEHIKQLYSTGELELISWTDL